MQKLASEQAYFICTSLANCSNLSLLMNMLLSRLLNDLHWKSVKLHQILIA